MNREITTQRALTTACLLFVGQGMAANQQMPNIIYILADDMGYGDVGCLNQQSKIPTPNIDRIGNEGMIFTDAHSPSSVSTPTRYGIMTGEYCFRSRLKKGVVRGYSEPVMVKGQTTVASLLKNAGYTTSVIGKWHLGLLWGKHNPELPFSTTIDLDLNNYPENIENLDFSKRVELSPNDFGFDYSYILAGSLDMSPFVFLENGRATDTRMATIKELSAGRGLFHTAGPKAESFEIGATLSNIESKSIEYIDNTTSNKPFFLYLPLTAPHEPWVPEERFKGRSGIGTYGDFICQIDEIVGNIVNALERKGCIDNTIIIFTSDNGASWSEIDIKETGHQANYKFRGNKTDIWEGGHRIPFLVRWGAKVPAGTTYNKIICLTDLIATCAELTDQKLEKDEGIDSYSLLRVLTDDNSKRSVRPDIVHHSLDGVFAIRNSVWKYIDGQGSGGTQNTLCHSDTSNVQLYNMVSDIGETKNLHQENPKIIKQLKDRLEFIKRQQVKY